MPNNSYKKSQFKEPKPSRDIKLGSGMAEKARVALKNRGKDLKARMAKAGA